MIDTHAHVLKEYYDNIDEVIKKMGNNIIILSGTSKNDNQEIIDLVEKYSTVYGTLGIHPEHVDDYAAEDLKFVEKYLNHPKIVGLGEIGLDYHYNYDKQKQQKLFIKQIKLANKYNKTMVIHSRDSIDDTYNILKMYKDPKIKINMHCYGSSLEMAKKFIELNGKLGIGGVVTFKNGKVLKEVVKNINLEHLLLETDCPFLSPEPLRGTKNEPYNIIYVAEEIAKIKKVSVKEVVKQTTTNAISQFDLNISL